jgi:glycosidase
VDRRLGDNQTLSALSAALHTAGIRLILDGVFNHVGRNFWAFRDVLKNGSASPFTGWFDGLRFDAHSPLGDPFTYTAWRGNFDLVRLNQANTDVRAHIFEAIRTWVADFGIDGLRLDVAECLDADFMRALRRFTDHLNPDFWLLGEVIHGDYRLWSNPAMLHSVTNYEAYKGLYSSLADKNYYEIAYALNRQFAPNGLYPGIPLYNFADNHDVNRVASQLSDPALLFPLYLLLFTMPGIPSIYYGSEFGLSAVRTPHDDTPLRPVINLEALKQSAPQPHLPQVIRRLADLRTAHPALRHGAYAQLFVAHQQLAFTRVGEDEALIILLNAAGEPAQIDINALPGYTSAEDVLNPGERFIITNGALSATVPPCWGRVLKLER